MEIVITMMPKNFSENFVRILIQKRLASCINVVKGVQSYFFWENQISIENEIILIIKTHKNLHQDLIQEIKKIHPYSVPAIITIDAKDVNKEYLSWMNDVLNIKE